MRRRYYYTSGSSRFEQSLDVYTPSDSLAANASESLPLVVLVVGSAWLGHRPLIYGGTSWWNSSGPKSVASIGAVCVCIRHRGAFPRPPTSPAALILFCLLTPLLLIAPVLLATWHMLARGGATHDEMVDDVASALLWVRANRAKLVAYPSAAPPSKMVFGGYSSGAHVAACLLQRPDLLAARGLPPAGELCDGVLFISGVLGTRLTCGANVAPRCAPALTNAISQLVFGPDAAVTLPSPVHDVKLSPALPHLFVCCEHEMFGLPVVEAAFSVYFASREMATRLAKRWVGSHPCPLLPSCAQFDTHVRLTLAQVRAQPPCAHQI